MCLDVCQAVSLIAQDPCSMVVEPSQANELRPGEESVDKSP